MSIPFVLPVHVIPKSNRDEVLGWEVDAAGDKWLKIRLTAVPEDGAANKALVKFLAKTFDIAPTEITLTRGENSRYKRLKIDDDSIIDKIQLVAA